MIVKSIKKLSVKHNIDYYFKKVVIKLLLIVPKLYIPWVYTDQDSTGS